MGPSSTTEEGVASLQEGTAADDDAGHPIAADGAGHTAAGSAVGSVGAGSAAVGPVGAGSAVGPVPGGGAVEAMAATAHWVAAYRQRESEGSHPGLDPFANLLADDTGHSMAATIPSGRMTGLAIAARTRIIDRAVREAVESDGYDTVMNLGAGLDTRPQRLALSRTVKWIEVDRGGMLAYKAAKLPPPLPCYQLAQVDVDLSLARARRALLNDAVTGARKVLVLAEGFVVYWPAEQVAELAGDLAQSGVGAWVLDLIAPNVLRRLQKRWSDSLNVPGRKLVFAPSDGPRFFEPYGWRPTACWPLVSDLLASGRAPALLRRFEETTMAGKDSRHWTAVVRLERS